MSALSRRTILPHRRLEWWLSAFTLAWGAATILDAHSIDSTSYVVARTWASAAVWGGVASVVGMFHLFALVVNGRRWWSPHVRVAATICNTGTFTLLAGAILAARWYGFEPATATITAYAGFVAAGIYAFCVAAHDACEASRQRRRLDART